MQNGQYIVLHHMVTVHYNFLPLLDNYTRYKIRLKVLQLVIKKYNQKSHFHCFSIEIASYKNFDLFFKRLMYFLDSLVLVCVLFCSLSILFFLTYLILYTQKENKKECISSRAFSLSAIMNYNIIPEILYIVLNSNYHRHNWKMC